MGSASRRPSLALACFLIGRGSYRAYRGAPGRRRGPGWGKLKSPEPPSGGVRQSIDRRAALVLLKALAEENRLAILEALRGRGEMSVSETCEAVGIDMSAISHHLACLKNCGLVRVRRDGKHLLYSLNGRSRVARILELVQGHVREVREGILACDVAALHPLLRPRASRKR